MRRPCPFWLQTCPGKISGICPRKFDNYQGNSKEGIGGYTHNQILEDINELPSLQRILAFTEFSKYLLATEEFELRKKKFEMEAYPVNDDLIIKLVETSEEGK